MTADITLPKQFKEIHKPKRYKVFYGGRGSGKSWAIAIVLLLLSLSKRITILCCREIQNSLADSVYQLLVEQIERLNISSQFTITKTEIIANRTKSRFIFKGLYRNVRSIKSIEGVDVCWIEEAECVSQESLDYLIPTIRKKGSEIWISFNPDQETDPVYKNFVLTDREDVYKAKVNYTDNPFFPEVLKKEMEWDKENDPDRYSWVWEGNTREHTDALVFKGKFVVKHFDTPDDAVFYHGADWGFSVDPTTLVRCYISDNCLYIDREVYEVGMEIDDTPNKFREISTAETWQIIADNARPETISYMRRAGFRIKGSRKGKGSVESGIEMLRSFDKIYIHPSCTHTVDEFKTYSYKTDKLTGNILPVILDKNNHIIDALRYAIEDITRGRNRKVSYHSRRG